MTPGARLASAIEILEEIETMRQPAAQVLKDWGARHRFAGSKDRAAISALVYDALRMRSSAACIMGGETNGRAVLLGTLARARGLDAKAIASLCSGDGYAPAPLSDIERERLEPAAMAAALTVAPAHVAADFPEWLEAPLRRAWGDALVMEAAAMAQRAPIDLRANALRTDRDKILSGLSHLHPEPTSLSPVGVRLKVGKDGRGPALGAEPIYAKGLVELQDEGSQIAALVSGAQAGWQVLDLCAGAGGKTLALAAMMGNRGQIYATDNDGRRLMPIFKRLENAGVRNVQVRAPKGGGDVLADLEERCHLVFVDAPCTGSGTWRRNPDAKWRIRPGALDQRIRDQDEVLEAAARFVRPGGRIVYVTCSVLCEENEDRVAAFLEKRTEFAPVEAGALARNCGIEALGELSSPHGPGLRLSPNATGTDGFYIAVLARVA